MNLSLAYLLRRERERESENFSRKTDELLSLSLSATQKAESAVFNQIERERRRGRRGFMLNLSMNFLPSHSISIYFCFLSPFPLHKEREKSILIQFLVV
jgi:hypothetical protein